MELPISIEDKEDRLIELCKKYKVSKLFIFGSSANGKFDPKESDLDLIVELETQDPIEKGENLIRFWSEVEHLFSRKVDLLTDKKIHNPYLRKQIESTKRLIYDRAS